MLTQHSCRNAVDREIFKKKRVNNTSTEFTCAALTVLLRFFKPADGLPDPKGSLLLSVPLRGIASANQKVLESTSGPKWKGRSTFRTGDTAQKNALSVCQ